MTVLVQNTFTTLYVAPRGKKIKNIYVKTSLIVIEVIQVHTRDVL